MGLRRLIVEVDPSTMNVTAFCRDHGIGTSFFWSLRARYAAEGEAGLAPRSRAAHRVANKTSGGVEDLIVAKRKELVDAGLDAGAGSIHAYLEGVEGLPSVATIWRILTARGFIDPEPFKGPKHSGRRFEGERANECWQIDDTTWPLADGTEVKVLNVIDYHSRLLVASVAMATCTGANALAAVAGAAKTLGWPAWFLSDNARAFRHVLAAALAELGVAAGHSRPYHPQTNGKVERFHWTLKKRLAARPPAHNLDQLQTELDLFRFIYNHQRPHRSISRRRPAQAWTDAPKSGPANRPLGGPTRLNTSRVHNGTVRTGRRYQLSIGAAHNGALALIIRTGTNCHVFINGRLVRALTINPERDHQPLNDRTGRPPTT